MNNKWLTLGLATLATGGVALLRKYVGIVLVMFAVFIGIELFKGDIASAVRESAAREDAKELRQEQAAERVKIEQLKLAQERAKVEAANAEKAASDALAQDISDAKKEANHIAHRAKEVKHGPWEGFASGVGDTSSTWTPPAKDVYTGPTQPATIVEPVNVEQQKILDRLAKERTHSIYVKNTIQRGMTEADVRQLAGQPDRIQPEQSVYGNVISLAEWHYGDVYVVFSYHKVNGVIGK